MHKKAVTLIEILLVVILSALLMAAIIPFIRSVSSTWEVGSSKQEMLQNGRAALEMMTRYIRQARRIIKIPGSSGNYIRIRDPQDTYNIVFYHNVSGSSSWTYIAETRPPIKTKDLVMQSQSDATGAYVNSLLASSLDSLTFNFLQDNWTLANKAIDVKSVRIQMVLKDPLGSTSYTLALEDTVTWRQDVKLLIWAITSSSLTDIAYGVTVGGFNINNTVSNCLSINPNDLTCWVADRGNNRLRKISSSGAVLWTVAGFNAPRAVSINNNPNWSVNGKETVWVANTGANSIRRMVWTSTSNTWTYASASGGVNWTFFSTPSSVSVNSDWSVNGKETCWVADTGGNRVRRIYAASATTWTYESLTGTNWTAPYSVSVNPNEIYYNKESCWVAYTTSNMIRRIYAASATTWTYDTIPGFSGPRSVSVNPNETINGRNTCWVADRGGNRIRKIYWTGITWSYATFTGFNSPYSVSVNPDDDTCWVADYNNNRIVRLGASGTMEWSISGFTQPMAVSVRP